jgi:N-acetylneuraminic acid mutarotase
MYVLSGFDGTAVMASVIKFDSTQGNWSHLAPMPEPKFALGACAVGSDIYVFGGMDDGSRPQASVFKFDTVANVWTTVAPMPYNCRFPSVSVLSGLVYIVGTDEDHRDVLRFDPASAAWSTLAPTSNRKQYATSFVIGDCLYVAGGIG